MGALTTTGVTSSGAIAVNSSNGITTDQTTFALVNTTATTVNFAGAATTIAIGGSSGTITLGNATLTGTNLATYNMNGTNPGIVTTSTGTAAVFNTNALTGNLFGAATAVNIGATTGTATIRNATINLSNASAVLQINGTTVLNGTTLGSGVTASSLTSVGTLSALTVTTLASVSGAESTMRLNASSGKIYDLVSGGGGNVSGNVFAVRDTNAGVNRLEIVAANVNVPGTLTENSARVATMGKAIAMSMVFG